MSPEDKIVSLQDAQHREIVELNFKTLVAGHRFSLGPCFDKRHKTSPIQVNPRSWPNYFPAALARRPKTRRKAERVVQIRYDHGGVDRRPEPKLLYHPLGPQSFLVTSKYSLRRRHPVLGIVRPHWGVDFGAAAGCAVYAAHAGEVSYWRGAIVVTSKETGLSGEQSRLQTRYRHVVPDKAVLEGRFVRAGDRIGRVNVRERGTTGAHLHFEMLVPRGSRHPWDFGMEGWRHIDPETKPYTIVLDRVVPTPVPIESARDASSDHSDHDARAN